jgi:hypothetical protein
MSLGPANEKTYVEIIIDDHHGCVTACALTLDLDDSELPVLCRLSRLYSTKMTACSVENFGGAT